jgi:hypothetical protein
MRFSLQAMLNQQVGGDTIRQMSQVLGADEGATSNAVQAALPLLIGALARNSSNPEGADALANALSNDHDGSILDNLAGFLGNASAGSGDGILRHVLGDRRSAVESGISQTSGLDASSVSQLLTMLAPIVMGALGRTQRQQGLDAGNVAALLGNEHQQIQESASPVLGMLSQLLDTNNDGSVLDDVARMVGGFLGGRR